MYTSRQEDIGGIGQPFMKKKNPKTFHATIEQDLNPRPCAVNDHPSVLAHEMMAIEPGEKPTRMLTWKTTSFLSHIQPRSHEDHFPIPLWET
jgi:hypothetical protein